MNYIKTLCLGAIIFIVTFFSGFGIYAFYCHKDMIVSVSETSYQNGYEKGFLVGKEEVTKVLRHEYQNFIYRMTEENADPKDVKHQIIEEKRIDRIMMKSNPKLSEAKRNAYKQYIMKWSRKFELSPVFVASMIHRETNFNEKAVSKSNARGPMQAIAKWHPEKLKKLGIKEKDLHSINHGVHVGCWIIKEYLERCNWNYREALKKYVGAVNNSADGYIDDIFKMTMYAYEE